MRNCIKLASMYYFLCCVKIEKYMSVYGCDFINCSAGCFPVIFLVCVIPVQLEFKIIIHDGRSRVFVISALGGLIHFRYSKTLNRKNRPFLNVGRKDSPPGKRIFDDGLFGFIKEVMNLPAKFYYLEYLKDRIRIKEFSLSAQIGTGDAANTAILAAGLYTLHV